MKKNKAFVTILWSFLFILNVYFPTVYADALDIGNIGNTKGKIIRGLASFQERLRIIDRAQKEIFLKTFKMGGDEAAYLLTLHLLAARERGVRVEVFPDPTIMWFDVRSPQKYLKQIKLYRQMMAGGIKVYGFRCHKAFLPLDFVQNSLSHRPQHPWALMGYRHHDKMLLSDDGGSWASITGGSNINNGESGGYAENGKNWWDLDLLLQGEKQYQVLKDIFETTARDLSRSFPDPAKTSCLNKFDPLLQREEFNNFKKEHFQKWPRFRAAILKRLQQKVTDDTIHPLRNLEKVHFVYSNPSLGRGHYHIEDYYTRLINEAKESVEIETSYIFPTGDLLRSINNAAKRGVRINMVTNGGNTIDVPVIKKLLEKYPALILDLKQGQFHLFHWHGRGDKNKKEEDLGLLHSKIAVIDNKQAIIGSYNLDFVSHYAQYELIFKMEGHDIVADLMSEIERDKKRCNIKINKTISSHEK